MKKFLRITGIAFFSIAVFLVVTLLVLLKQGRLRPGLQAQAPSSGSAEPVEPLRAGLLASGGNAAGTHGAGPAVPGENEAVAIARALFHLPQPLTYDELDGLMKQLQVKVEELEQREAALSFREKQLQILDGELERKRASLLERARDLAAAAPPAAETGDAETAAIDPARAKKLAKLFELMKAPDQIAKDLAARPPSEAATLLDSMTDKEAAKILAAFTEEQLRSVTAALLALRRSDGGR